MNYRIVAKLLGYFCMAIGVLMTPSVLWALYFAIFDGDTREWMALVAFGESMVISFAVGGVLATWGRSASDRFYQREALGLVGISWIVAAALGALPFVFDGILNPVDAYFESMSGFTTTGSSVFSVEMFTSTPRSIMFWRSFTHWLGGMGIIVLFIAVLPYLGAGGKQLFRSESPGPDPRGLRPRIRDTASILYKIYLGFTIAQTILLMFAGLNLYEALCQTFGTLATGGFSTEAASVAGFHSVAVDVIIIFFMVCAGTNFGLYFFLLRGNWKGFFRDTEWRIYVGIMAVATLLVTLNLMGVEGKDYKVEQRSLQEQAGKSVEVLTLSDGATGTVERQSDGSVITSLEQPDGSTRVVKTYESFPQALRYAAFQVVSIMTTTGFCTDNFDIWPNFSRVLLLALMFIGGCAGSTGGGIKVVRVVMLVKMAYWRLESTFRPKTVRAIRVSGQVIDERIQRVVYGYFVLIIGWFALGSLFMSLLGLPLETAVTSVIATLNNIGPGLAGVGATQNFAAIPAIGKVFLSLSMVLGRLEVFSIMVLLLPAFWRQG